MKLKKMGDQHLNSFFSVMNRLRKSAKINKMARFGSLIKVRPEFKERYIILHKHTFPEVLARIKKSNIQNYSIFLYNDLLFSFYEYAGTNHEADMAAIGEDVVTQDWWKLTDPMQEPLDNRKPGEWWATMEEIFYIGEKRKPSPLAQRIVFCRKMDSVELEQVKSNSGNIPLNLPDLLKQVQVQNYSVFYRDGDVYVYYEYVGQDLSLDMNQLGGDETRLLLSSDKSPAMLFSFSSDNRWVQMQEVFHSD